MNDKKEKSIPTESIAKICIICNEAKPLSFFGKSVNYKCGINSVCKVCHNKRAKEWKIDNPGKYKKNYNKQNKSENHKEGVKTWRAKNKVKHLETQYLWRKNNPEKWAMIQRNGQLKRLYGIDHSVYLKMLESQNGKCKICGSETHNGRGLYFHVDHDHKTGTVRGLLCHHCNTLIGCSEDKISTLKESIKYLELHNV